MKVWQVILFSAPLLAVGTYLSYRYSPNAPELNEVEKALKGAALVSSVVVADSSDIKSTLPLPEIQRTYVVRETYSGVQSRLVESLRSVGWAEIYGGGQSLIVQKSDYQYTVQSPTLVFTSFRNERSGSITIVGGKASVETPFGATPLSEDPEYTTIYVSWVKKDPTSRALAMIKVK